MKLDTAGDLILGTDCNTTVTISGNLTALCDVYQTGGVDTFRVLENNSAAFVISGAISQGGPAHGKDGPTDHYSHG